MAAGALAGLASAAQASFPGQNGRIAFSEDHTIYTMKSDGTDVQTVLAAPPRRNAPAWSPDGTKLAYSRGTRRQLAQSGGCERRRQR